MSAITRELTTAQTRSRSFGRIVPALAHLLGWPVRVARARRDMQLLAGMNAVQLSDIGLTSQDLQDAISQPLGEDPTQLLARRVRERRRR